jgi:hypothetical protein
MKHLCCTIVGLRKSAADILPHASPAGYFGDVISAVRTARFSHFQISQGQARMPKAWACGPKGE